MNRLRFLWLEPVLKDLQDRDNTDFMMLESRLRSAYIKLDSDFREEARGSESLCFNLAYVYDLVGYANLFTCFRYNALFRAGYRSSKEKVSSCRPLDKRGTRPRK